jgi:hypothetical protein
MFRTLPRYIITCPYLPVTLPPPDSLSRDFTLVSLPYEWTDGVYNPCEGGRDFSQDSCRGICFFLVLVVVRGGESCLMITGGVGGWWWWVVVLFVLDPELWGFVLLVWSISLLARCGSST